MSAERDDLPPLDVYADEPRAQMKQRPNGRAAAEKPALPLLTLEEFVVRPSVSALIDRILPPRSIVVAFGPPKGGKTFTICDLAMHAAHGSSAWHGFAIRRPLRVAFLAGEGIIGLKIRLHAWRQHHDRAQLTGDFRLVPQALALPDHTSDVIDTLREYSPDLIVVDTLNAYFGQRNENDTADMTTFCTAVRSIRDALDCSIIIIHHTGLNNQSRERGSIVLRASADVVIQIDRDQTDPTIIGFQVIAARDIETMATPLALRLRRVETDWEDDDGRTLTSCLVEAAGVAGPVTLAGQTPLGGRQRELLEIAYALARAKGGQGEVTLARDDIRQEALRRKIPKQTISSAWEPLEERGFWRRVEPGSVIVRVPS